MRALLIIAGRVGGLLGIALCLAASAARLAGHFWLVGFQLATLLQLGIAAIGAGCFCLLWSLTLERAGH